MNWIKSAVTDDRGQVDVAYLSLFAVMGAVFGAIFTMCMLSAIAYFRCTPVVREAVVLVTCNYDPQPLGIAIGAACGGFATALGALAGYMLATRTPKPSTTTVVNATQTTTTP